MCNHETEVISGADACVKVLLSLEARLAGDSAETTEQYFMKKDAAVAALLESAGQVSPRAAGAFRVLAEWIVTEIQDGVVLDPDQHAPDAALTAAELAVRRQRFAEYVAEGMRGEVSNVVPFARR